MIRFDRVSYIIKDDVVGYYLNTGIRFVRLNGEDINTVMNREIDSLLSLGFAFCFIDTVKSKTLYLDEKVTDNIIRANIKNLKINLFSIFGYIRLEVIAGRKVGVVYHCPNSNSNKPKFVPDSDYVVVNNRLRTYVLHKPTKKKIDILPSVDYLIYRELIK